MSSGRLLPSVWHRLIAWHPLFVRLIQRSVKSRWPLLCVCKLQESIAERGLSIVRMGPWKTKFVSLSCSCANQLYTDSEAPRGYSEPRLTRVAQWYPDGVTITPNAEPSSRGLVLGENHKTMGTNGPSTTGRPTHTVKKTTDGHPALVSFVSEPAMSLARGASGGIPSITWVGH